MTIQVQGIEVTSPARRDRQIWLSLACVVLLGYALFGKGAAYVGVPPLFIGEGLLLCGLVAMVQVPVLRMPMPNLLWVLGAFMLWGLLRTLPFVAQYGMEAMRDAVIWGYAAFSVIVFYHIVSKPERLAWVVRRYGQFTVLFLTGMPVVWGVRFVLGDSTPRWPWADVPVIEPKPGDAMVHLAGILAFWISGPLSEARWPRILGLSICAAVIGAYERAAMFAFLAVAGLCLVFRPAHPALHRLIALGVLVLGALAITGVRLEVPVADSAKVREISFQQFAANVFSAIGVSDMGDLDDTKEWRLGWWREIIRYTIRGEYFWKGKGFGVNLADDDGFQVMPDHSLRSPHNAHLTMLARCGVPGLVLWAAVQLGWAGSVLKGLLLSLRHGERRWAGLYLFLLGYWLAFMINATFDVFLEGPMGGIWFWSLYGVGLAALWVHRHQPEVIEGHADPDGA